MHLLLEPLNQLDPPALPFYRHLNLEMDPPELAPDLCINGGDACSTSVAIRAHAAGCRSLCSWCFSNGFIYSYINR